MSADSVTIRALALDIQLHAITLHTVHELGTEHTCF